MHTASLALFGLLSSATVGAFEITVFDNVGKCDANEDTLYRTIRGESNGTCYSFNGGILGANCVQYNKSTAETPMGCTTQAFLPMSIIQAHSNVACTFYSQGNCHGGSVQTYDQCVDGASFGIEKFESFSCTRVDILSNVGCHSGVSTGVCVNDCNCVCNGQVLYCPLKASKCNNTAHRLCQSYCNCLTPFIESNEETYVQNRDSNLITKILNLLKLMTVRLAELWW